MSYMIRLKEQIGGLQSRLYILQSKLNTSIRQGLVDHFGLNEDQIFELDGSRFKLIKIVEYAGITSLVVITESF